LGETQFHECKLHNFEPISHVEFYYNIETKQRRSAYKDQTIENGTVLGLNMFSKLKLTTSDGNDIPYRKFKRNKDRICNIDLIVMKVSLMSYCKHL